MAICPKCNGTMGQTDVRCPECGYDFADTAPEPSRPGFSYSPLADFALVIGGMCAVFGCLGAIFGGIVAAVNEMYWLAFLLAPLYFLQSLAMLVVFLRVLDVRPVPK